MRCCMKTLEDKRGPETDLPADGETINCAYCDEPMIIRDGVWRWNVS